MTLSVEELAREYERRQQRFGAQADLLAARSLRIGNLRGVSFVVGLGGLSYAYFGGGGHLALLLGVAGLVVFFAFVIHHGRIIEAEEHSRRWARVNAHGHARCTDGWRTLPVQGNELRPDRHPYAEDLDLFGKGSLFQRISVAHTRYGQHTLCSWLTHSAPPDEIRARQEAVRQLAPELEFRQALEAEGLAIVERRGKQPGTITLGESPDPEPLLRWAESPPALRQRRAIVAAAWILPPCTLAGLVASFGWGAPLWWWGFPLFLQIALLTSVRKETTEAFVAVSYTEGAFLRYGAMLALVEQLRVHAPWITSRQQRLRTGNTDPEPPAGHGCERSPDSASPEERSAGGHGYPPSPTRSTPRDAGATDPHGLLPSASMRIFRRRVGWFDLRHNGMVHPFINALLLWDLHCTLALESWKVRSGRHARGWFTILGEMEALASLAGLAHDEPGFCLPEILEPSSDGPRLEATGLGHPLLHASRRVTNDLTPLFSGHALLVTGSNMSGKSTFLRSVGCACVLALAGGPVCAHSMRLVPCQLRTSIRVSDSLASGVSHFYAEVERLKAALDATEHETPVLFLLDEILHGTNSRERQVGARWVLAELLRRGAFGVVTTHDMELCQLTPELMDHVQQAHFRESVRDDEMTFDYRLREGPVRAGNALRLMQLVGLPVPPE